MKKFCSLLLIIVFIVSMTSCRDASDGFGTDATDPDMLTVTAGPEDTETEYSSQTEDPDPSDGETIDRDSNDTPVTDPPEEDTSSGKTNEGSATASTEKPAETTSKTPVTTAPPSTQPPVTTSPETTVPVTTAPETTVHVHDFKIVSRTEPTCSVPGKAVYSCACGQSYTEEIETLPHDYAEATCVTPETCRVCGATRGGTARSHYVKNGKCVNCGKEVLIIGITSDQLLSLIGQPDEILRENTVSGTVFSYIYNNVSNPLDLRIYQILDNTVCGVYAAGKDRLFCHMPSAIIYEPTTCSEEMNIESNNDMDVISFYDIAGGGGLMAVWAKLVGFRYGLDTMSQTVTFGGKTVSDYSVQEKLCLYINNYYRACNGLPGLVYSPEAGSISLYHSIDMGDNDYFDHVDPNGASVGTRLDGTGVDYKACGENIHAGYIYIDDFQTTNVFHIVNSWYNSQSHREVMLRSRYTHFGAGFYEKPGSYYLFYSTEVFFCLFEDQDQDQ